MWKIVKLKNKDIYNVYKTLEYIKKIDVSKPRTYKFKAFDMRSALKGKFEALAEVAPKLQEELRMGQYDIMRRYVKKDESGKPVVKEGVDPNQAGFDQVEYENIDAMNLELAEYVKKADQEAIKAEFKEYEEVLEMEVEVGEITLFDENDFFDGLSEELWEKMIEAGVWIR